MKKILITGANSYIGTSFEKYIKENFPEDYIVDTVDMIDGIWKNKDFSGYDSVFHVAGIAHQKETKENAHLYYEVNRDLAIETARKAKADGVKQFIFLSSMSVYGMDTGVITRETKPKPKSNYGKSKWEAEQKITALASEEFGVCVLRPPMVYGEGCKGNYQTLIKIAKVIPFCPTFKNERSLISIDNLSKFVEQAIRNRLNGTFRIQNRDYVCTSDMIHDIARQNGRTLTKFSGFNWSVRLLMLCVKKAQKAFGTLKYINLEECEKL